MNEFIINLLVLGVVYVISNLIPMFLIFGRKNVSEKEMDDDYIFFINTRKVIVIIVLIILVMNLFNS